MGRDFSAELFVGFKKTDEINELLSSGEPGEEYDLMVCPVSDIHRQTAGKFCPECGARIVTEKRRLPPEMLELEEYLMERELPADLLTEFSVGPYGESDKRYIGILLESIDVSAGGSAEIELDQVDAAFDRVATALATLGWSVPLNDVKLRIVGGWC